LSDFVKGRRNYAEATTGARKKDHQAQESVPLGCQTVDFTDALPLAFTLPKIIYNSVTRPGPSLGGLPCRLKLSAVVVVVLTSHSASKPVKVKQTTEMYVGHARITQTEFGIKPIRVGGSMVKVKNELVIEFRIMTRPGLPIKFIRRESYRPRVPGASD